MRRKGFTLIELLIVIAIVIVSGCIIFVRPAGKPTQIGVIKGYDEYDPVSSTPQIQIVEKDGKRYVVKGKELLELK